MVRIETERSQTQNKRVALAMLSARLRERAEQAQAQDVNAARRQQLGTGMRSDKTVTIRFQADQAVNHVTGKRTTATRWMRGEIDAIW